METDDKPTTAAAAADGDKEGAENGAAAAKEAAPAAAKEEEPSSYEVGAFGLFMRILVVLACFGVGCCVKDENNNRHGCSCQQCTGADGDKGGGQNGAAASQGGRA